MQRQFTGSYLPPLGSYGQPVPLQPTPVQPPMIYVYEPARWEYKVVVRHIEEKALLSEDELNALGVDGWELAGAATLPQQVQFYFKRVRK
jgi:hypothetical protein